MIENVNDGVMNLLNMLKIIYINLMVEENFSILRPALLQLNGYMLNVALLRIADSKLVLCTYLIYNINSL